MLVPRSDGKRQVKEGLQSTINRRSHIHCTPEHRPAVELSIRTTQYMKLTWNLQETLHWTQKELMRRISITPEVAVLDTCKKLYTPLNPIV